MFPGVLLPLLDKCGIAADRAVQDHVYFGTLAQLRLILMARAEAQDAAVISIVSFADLRHYYPTNSTLQVLLVGHRTCDLQVVGSSPGWASLSNGLGQDTYVCVPLSSSSIVWYQVPTKGG